MDSQLNISYFEIKYFFIVNQTHQNYIPKHHIPRSNFLGRKVLPTNQISPLFKIRHLSTGPHIVPFYYNVGTQFDTVQDSIQSVSTIQDTTGMRSIWYNMGCTGQFGLIWQFIDI